MKTSLPLSCADACDLQPLVWTVGFCGKRFIPPDREDRIRGALRQALDYFLDEARSQCARLTAISSISRGADVLFAEACAQVDRQRVPWKCLLPYDLDAFLSDDLKTDKAKNPLPAAEINARKAKASKCLETAYVPAESTFRGPAGILATSQPLRDVWLEKAYLECGYRTVDEADVMLVVVTGDEFRQIKDAHDRQQAAVTAWEAGRDQRVGLWEDWMKKYARAKRFPPFFDEPSKEPRPDLPEPPVVKIALPPEDERKAGTVPAAKYALAAKRPVFVLNAEDADPWGRHLRIMDRPAAELFKDPDVTPTVKEALRTCVPTNSRGLEGESLVKALLHCLDTVATNYQKQARGGLTLMLGLHLGASCVAALFATVLDFQHDHWKHIAGFASVVLLIIALAALKPLAAFWAWRIEHDLDHKRVRQKWVTFRILAEICRSALDRWMLPIQPLDAMDEEDFPKIKRLIRSLRLLRELESPSPGAADVERLDAEMKTACETYAQKRLEGQAGYFLQEQWLAMKSEKFWHRLFECSLLITIIFGLLTVLLKIDHAYPCAHESTHHLEWPWEGWMNWLGAVVIIGPFLAAFALGKITVSDARRRALRYDEMHHYLTRLSQTLRACEATSSQLRIIEHAERMLIEEQHEWFSVTRNYTV